MTETFNQMLARHQKEIAEFRNKCKHTRTEMKQRFWAPGHGGGMAKCCQRCGMVIGNTYFPNIINNTPKIGEDTYFDAREFLLNTISNKDIECK